MDEQSLLIRWGIVVQAFLARGQEILREGTAAQTPALPWVTNSRDAVEIGGLSPPANPAYARGMVLPVPHAARL